MTFETVLYEVRDHVAEIRFNRPQRLNAVVQKLYDDLRAALRLAEEDRDVRAVLLTGEGRAFCVGADLKEHKAGTRSAFDRHRYLKSGQLACKRIQDLAKPVVAAVNGFALGAGAEMAIACDFLVMAAGARIGLPEVSIGTFIGGGVTFALPRLVGLAKARELVFLGERIDGVEAARIGLATRVFSDDRFMEQARDFAHQLATKAPLSMALAKAQLNRAAEASFESALTAELEGMTFCTTTRDWQEGVDAFAEKRQPVFRGE